LYEEWRVVALLFVDSVTSPSGEHETTNKPVATNAAKRCMKPPVNFGPLRFSGSPA
jgi:hypothetical protein